MSENIETIEKDEEIETTETKDITNEVLREMVDDLKTTNEALVAEMRELKKQQIKLTETYGRQDTKTDVELFSLFDRKKKK